MSSGTPKQFLLLSGLPVLMHAIRAFYRFDPGTDLIVALPSSLFPDWKRLCRRYDFNLPHRLSKGGKSRFHTVKNALKLAGGSSFVAIHDGVRPLVSRTVIAAAFRDARKYGNAVPVIPVAESVRWVTTGINETFSRDQLRIVQTPQVFRTELVRKAYELAPPGDYTDDATVVERLGEKIHLVDGNRENIKITYPSDLILAEALIRHIT